MVSKDPDVLLSLADAEAVEEVEEAELDAEPDARW